MGKVCGDVYDVIPEAIVLAFEVAGWDAPDSVSLTIGY